MGDHDSYLNAKQSLLEAISDEERKVIALSGEWGVGKTHLWNEIKNSSEDKKITESIYITGFGANGISEIKLRILQNTILSDRPSTKVSFDFISSYLNKLTGKSAEDLFLLLLPKAIENKLVVIDDVERQSTGLSIDQFMGFLNEYSEAYKSQFLILLNTNKLEQKERWDELHEKVIDIEITLNPSPKECFYKIMSNSLSEVDERLLRVLAILDVRNIRVIKKIVKNISLLKRKFNIDEVPSVRWVPSVALLTALAYRALEDGPTFEYMRSYNPYSRLLNLDKDKDSKEHKWNGLIDSLEINHTDDFEIIFIDFLKTGILDEKRLANLVLQYKADAINQAAHDKRNEFFKSVFWDSHQTKVQLLDEARELLCTAQHMDPQTVSSMAEVVVDLGDDFLATQYIDAWETSLNDRPGYQNLEERVLDNSYGKLHPRVFSKLKQMRDIQHPPIGIYEAANNIIQNSGWGEKERIAFKDSTKEKYIEVICGLDKIALHKFFKLHFEWFRNSSYDAEFSTGRDNFTRACLEILKTKPAERISEIIINQFTTAGCQNKLIETESVDLKKE
jgi:hypothetical protein